MTMENIKNIKRRDKKIHLRVTTDEYNTLKEASRIYNKKVSTMLLESIFSKLPQKILMTSEHLIQLMSEIKRIGNNINQVAKKINSGDVPPTKSVDAAVTEINKILHFLEANSGLR